MLINDIYKFLQFVSNKNQGSGYLSPDDYNIAVQAAQLRLQNKLMSPLGDEALARTTIEIEALAPFKKKLILNVNGGNVDKPSDYLYPLAISSIYYDNDTPSEVAVEMVREDELASRLMSNLKAPSTRFPIASNRGNKFYIYPENTQQIRLSYIQQADAPFWNYTLSASGVPQFAETGGVLTNPNDGSNDSTDFTFGYDDFNDLVFEIAQDFGISVREQDLFQFSKIQENDK